MIFSFHTTGILSDYRSILYNYYHLINLITGSFLELELVLKIQLLASNVIFFLTR